MTAWYVLAIRAQRWKKIIAKLLELEVTTYYPMRTVWRKQRRGPRERRDYPLIPSYVFVATDLTKRSARSILSIDGISCFLGIEGVPGECDPDELTRMRDSERRGAYDETAQIIEQLIVGQTVPVEYGGLAGMHMTIRAIHGDTITGDVELFGRTNSIKINIDNLAKSI